MKQSTIALLLTLTLAQTLFAQGLSKKCIDELIAAKGKSNSDLQGFSTDLVAEVVKVKLQLKLPFGKPADSKVTDMGMTVGCLKAFPENPAQILPILKEAGLDAAKGAVANELAANSQPQATGVQTQTQTTSSLSPFPALKECDALFNPEKKFCYDGGVYNKCDGIIYNPTTHICSGDVAYRALCNGVQYNPLTQKCENNAILAKCGENFYNTKTHGCKGSTVFALSECGENKYNPETHGCGENNVVLAKCGTLYYNSAKHSCENGVIVFPKCGKTRYNPETHGCGKNNVLLTKCGATSYYNPAKYNCKDGVVLGK